MTRSTYLLAFALLASCTACLNSAEKPNVLFIAVDDLRPILGCYGDKQIKTPNIDELAAHGTVFKRAYCQVAVCGASRASLLTGLRPTPKRFLNYKTYAEKDAPGAMTLPEEFKENGYHCISNGKIFHHREDTADRSWSEKSWRPSIGGATPIDPKSEKMRGGTKNRGPVFEAPDVPDNAYPDGMIADKTITDLERMKEQGQPFFLACGFLKPHLPFYAPKKYWDLYDGDRIELADNQYRPKNAPTSLKGSTEILSYHDRGLEYNSEEWHRNNRHGYFACVSYIDAQIGRVLDALDQLSLRENTIIVLWGDHGFHLGEHNFWGKHNVMHLSTNAPLIVSAPGFKVGQKCDRLVEFVDIYPTLCELSGIKTENTTLHGKSFQPLLASPTQSWKKAVYSKFSSSRSVITDRYNYAEFKNGDKLLFDLTSDAAENANIASRKENKELVGELSQLLAKPANGVAFVHPGVAHTRESISFIKSKIAAGEQPWKDAWQQLTSSEAASLKWKPKPRAHVQRGVRNNPDIGGNDFLESATAAYTHSLRWAFTNDAAHAKKAAEIIDAWSRTLKTVTNHDARLLIGMGGHKYCNAAELLKHTWDGWPEANQKEFESMLRDVWYPVIKDFYPSANGNWDASMLQTMIAMGVVLDDRALFDRAVTYYRCGKGNGAIGNYFNEFGECQETGRDQAHTQMGLEYLANTCETAWSQNIDLYGELDNRLLKGFEYTAKYNLGHDVPYEPFKSFEGRYHYKKISNKSRGRLRPMYEKVFNHYHNRKGLDAPFTEQAIEKVRPNAGRRRSRSSGLPWETLMFAKQP